MENNQVPAIWISNQVRQIDKAYLRRFDYSVSFPTPPHAIRVSMAEHHLAVFEPPRAWLENWPQMRRSALPSLNGPPRWRVWAVLMTTSRR